MSANYDDIINLPHHVSNKHPQMSMHNRAAQFAPFAALVGYDAALDETARLTEVRRELDDNEQARLDARLKMLQAHISEQPEITIEHFVADARKDGGAYVKSSGNLAKVSYAARSLILADGQCIHIADITAIDSALFNGQEDTTIF